MCEKWREVERAHVLEEEIAAREQQVERRLGRKEHGDSE